MNGLPLPYEPTYDLLHTRRSATMNSDPYDDALGSFGLSSQMLASEHPYSLYDDLYDAGAIYQSTVVVDTTVAYNGDVGTTVLTQPLESTDSVVAADVDTVAAFATDTTARVAETTTLTHDASTTSGLDGAGAANVVVVGSDATDVVGNAAMTTDEPVATGATAADEGPVIDIAINNVVCAFNTRCRLQLRTIAVTGMNVEYKRATGMVSMKLRNPGVTASIWSSGKITCTGSRSEEESHISARKVARCLWRLGFKVKFTDFRVVNVLGTCSLPFGIDITEFSRNHPKVASYEPELHPGVTYKLASPKATLKIFSTGSITVTAPRVTNVQRAIEHIFPLVHEYKMAKPKPKQGAAATAVASYERYVAPYGAAKRSRTEDAARHGCKRRRYGTNEDSDDDDDYSATEDEEMEDDEDEDTEDDDS